MSENLCPRCKTPIPTQTSDSELELQCPRCLLRPPWDKPIPVAITLGPGQSFLPPSIEELAPHIVGYDVEALIGQGGMGAVYLGRQKSLDRPVAIKILPPQIAERKGFRERFAQEGRALAKLNHPNIVSVHDFGQAGPYAMLVMELVEGANLREVLAQGRLSPTEALEIIPQLCDALSYAHEEGVVHRDIKPENLLFDSRGRLKITDFGLAKLLLPKSDGNADPQDNEQSSPIPDPTQGVVGTVHYMAPEQLENPKSVDHRADIYALGVVFYEMLTGELPIGRFDAPSQRMGQPTSDGLTKLLIDVRLDEVVLRALEKQPEKRYASASELMDDIDSIEKDTPTSAAVRIFPEKQRRQFRETIHRVGETASGIAASGFEAGEEFLAGARNRWLHDSRVEIPSYLSLAILLCGSMFSLLIANQPQGEAAGLMGFLITCVTAFVLARVALQREQEPGDHEPLFITRFVLACLCLLIAAPLLIGPMLAAFAGWLEVYGDPRDIGRVGWLRDWVQISSVIVIVTSLCWLVLLAFHWGVPSVFAAVFKPFVKPLTYRVGLPLTLVLGLLIATAVVAMRQLPYATYVPGTEVAEQSWEQLSPRDFSEFQRWRARQEITQARQHH
ncbi:serine/threonine protein kinase [Stieleria sp. TO1_6]|uniref:serine/threonine-protein kinase n=1 Tax=Stieleria tagensis TaxID=2956795 RepID=UPI00209B2A0C|nr:serine/threonine-protein kinase [Stieleria tagensis]MCO8122339.1 serine/threonine protein kinase [Stieleria tagensis]